MRLLYLHLYDAGFGMGGAEKVLLDLARCMKGSYNHEVHCLVNESSLADALRKVNVPVTTVPYAKIGAFKLARNLLNTCALFEPGIIHSHHRFTTFAADLLVKKRYPVIHTEHVLRSSKKFLFRYGNLATAVHSSVADNLINYYRVPNQHVRSITNGVAQPVVVPQAIEEMQRRYPGNSVKFLCIGRLEEQKGHVYLLRAAAALPQEYREKLKIFLAGDGSLEAHLKKEAAALGVQNNFIFLGHSPNSGALLRFCDIFILPSLWEGLPLSVLEAFSMGKPVIATGIEGTKDLVQHNETGLLAPPRDPAALAEMIKILMDRPELRQSIAAAGYRLWENRYSLQIMASRYQKLYQELAASS